MAISYNKLWKLMIDKKISASELRKMSGIAPNTMTRIRKDKEVSLDVLGRICNSLYCDFGDIVEYIHDENVPKGGEDNNG